MEELMQIEITSVSKRPEKLASAPAAVFALTEDDLRRAGAQNFPEALRLVPGLHVAQTDGHNWAIGARGFTDTFANKLLVLRDGRSLYTPLFSGVFWDVQDTLLEDIERIEVVRGPGATLWGANAVNGIINILSKPARETQGLLAVASAGSSLKHSGGVRYGGARGQTFYRVYAKHSRTDDFPVRGSDASAHDAQQLGVAGFRVDNHSIASRTLTLQGDVYNGRENQVFLQPTNVPPTFLSPLLTGNRMAGGNVIGRLTQSLANGGETKTQVYYDYTSRDTALISEDRHTFDLELQHRATIGSRQELTFGAGYRSTDDDIRSSQAIVVTPASRRADLWSAFVQDDIALVAGRAHLILGSKLEHNDYSGAEFQPGARFLWTPNAQQTFWASAARAVRTPSRADHDIKITQPLELPGVLGLAQGNPAVGAEQLNAYELGYRFRTREKFTADLSLFYNDYLRLRSSEIDPASLQTIGALLAGVPLTPPILISTQEALKLHGETYGGEVSLGAQLTRTWRLRATYSYLRMDLRLQPDSTDLTGVNAERRSPRHQAYLWSQHDLGAKWHLDWRLRFVDALPAAAVPDYTELDVRIAWRPADRWELSVVGQNLLQPRHPEFVPSSIATPIAEVPRGYYLQVRYGY